MALPPKTGAKSVQGKERQGLLWARSRQERGRKRKESPFKSTTAWETERRPSYTCPDLEQFVLCLAKTLFLFFISLNNYFEQSGLQMFYK